MENAELKFSESAQALRALVDGLPGMVGVSAPDGQLTFGNRALCELLETTEVRLQKHSWCSCAHPDDVEAVRSAWLCGSARAEAFTICCRILRQVDAARSVEIRLAPCVKAGRVQHWYGLIIDMDERTHAENKLRESAREMKLFVESMPALLWRATPDGNADYINEAVIEYTGQPLKDFADFRWLTMIHPDDIEAAGEAWRHALTQGDEYSDIHRKRGADGIYRSFQQLGRPVRDAQGQITHWYGLSIDVDERIKLEETLTQMQAQLARTAQVLAVAQLAAAIAHEVSQPLAALTASAHACQHWLSTTPPNLDRARTNAERAIRNGQAASEVVDHIRALFQQSPLQKVALDINTLARDVHNLMLEEVRSNGASLAFDLSAELPVILADRVQIQQVLVNLIRNGIEAMSAVRDRPREVQIHSKHESAHEIVVEVRDRGRGIPDPRALFEPFFTTKRRGTGMGLAICNSIVEAHGGRIWAHQNETQGATFAFALPVYRAEHG